MNTFETLYQQKPFWNSSTILGESAFFTQETEDGAAVARLMAGVDEILEVRAANRGAVYEEGKDFTVDKDGRGLLWREGSAAVKMTLEDFYPRFGLQTCTRKVNGRKCSLWWVEGHVYHDRQIEVDYTTKEQWDGVRPGYFGEKLPRTMDRLLGGKALTQVHYGDSISVGGNASGKIGAEPMMPAYASLIALNLAHRYGSEIAFHNVSQGGMASGWGLENVGRVTEHKPDLLVLGWGINDASGQVPADDFEKNMRGIIAAVREGSPSCEVILVTMTTANPDWRAYGGAYYGEYMKRFARLGEMEGVAVADVHTLWCEVLAKKRFFDMIANGVNHPNDFGHRLMAQVVLSGLIENMGG